MSEIVTNDAKIETFVEIMSSGPDQKSVLRLRTEKADDVVRDHIRMSPGSQPYKHN